MQPVLALVDAGMDVDPVPGPFTSVVAVGYFTDKDYQGSHVM